MSDSEAGRSSAEQPADGAPEHAEDVEQRAAEAGPGELEHVTAAAADVPSTDEPDAAVVGTEAALDQHGAGFPEAELSGTADDTALASDAETADADTEPGDAPSTHGDTEQAGDAAEPAQVSEAPDLTEDADLDAALEALLLVVDVPAGEELLADALEQPVARIRSALERLAAGYTETGRGIDLRRVGDGWRFYTREAYAPYVERYLLDGQRSKLTRAALETLAVVAYRQPVTRSRVAAVRGVNVDGVIRTLVGRGLVEEAGTDPSTGGILYCTTELFLERLGLSSLKDLPPLAPLLPEVDAIDDV